MGWAATCTSCSSASPAPCTKEKALSSGGAALRVAYTPEIKPFYNYFPALRLGSEITIYSHLRRRGPWRYGAHDGCSEFGLGCYFQPHDQCSHALHMGAAADPLEGVDTLKEQRVGTWHAPNWEQVEPRADGYIPHTLSLPQHHGVLWWRAHLAMWLMQPKPALALRLRRMKSELGWRGQVIGVHVRRGDACFHAQTSSYRPPCAQWEE
jgi:hypothetical protein